MIQNVKDYATQTPVLVDNIIEDFYSSIFEMFLLVGISLLAIKLISSMSNKRRT
ncbi:MAG: hypothetical protein R3267_05190 [Paenisporosarcina sp.]|nr:hypothetical protein [Paenisporosarcina sp.]